MNNQEDKNRDAYLDSLVFARDILWQTGQTEWLGLIEVRLNDRYKINLWELKSPVGGN